MSVVESAMMKEDGDSATSFPSSLVEAGSTASTAAAAALAAQEDGPALRPAAKAAPEEEAGAAEDGSMDVGISETATTPTAPAPAGDSTPTGCEGSAGEPFSAVAGVASVAAAVEGLGAVGAAACPEAAGQEEDMPVESTGPGGPEATAGGDLPGAYVLENTSPAVRAVLEGTATCEDGIWRFAGRWRLRWHDALTSEFEWHFAGAGASPERPCSGAYEGYFHMVTPQGQAQFEESELRLNFAENAEGGFNVEGDGKNVFGLFGIRGVVHPNRVFQFLKLASNALARSSTWTQTALELMRYTGSSPHSKWFRKPVPGTVCVTRGQEIVWYNDVIKTPMDFQTLRDNLKEQRYASLDAFVAAARLIFTNAWTFNRPGDQCFADADVVYLRFERRLSQLTGEPMPAAAAAVEARVKEAAGSKPRKRAAEKTAEELAQTAGRQRAAPRTAAARATKRQETEVVEVKGEKVKSELREELHEARKQMEQLQEQLRELKSREPKPGQGGRGAGRGPRRKEKAAAPSPARAAARSPAAASKGGRTARGTGAAAAAKGGQAAEEAASDEHMTKPLTEKEKERLQERIDLLDEERLEEVLDFLSSDLAATGSADGGAEVQLDVEALQPARQRALVDFVEVQLRRSSG